MMMFAAGVRTGSVLLAFEIPKHCPGDANATTNPVLVIEVLSPSSEAYDRGAKAAHYRRLDSLREYLLVSQDAPRLELFRRVEGDRWELVEARAGERLALASVGVSIDVDAVFADPLAT